MFNPIRRIFGRRRPQANPVQQLVNETAAQMRYWGKEVPGELDKMFDRPDEKRKR